MGVLTAAAVFNSGKRAINEADAGRARQHLPEPTGLWRVPGAHLDAVGGSRGALEWGAVKCT